MYSGGGVGGEETRLLPECDLKRDQAKSKDLEFYYRMFCRKSNTRN